MKKFIDIQENSDNSNLKKLNLRNKTNEEKSALPKRLKL